MLLTQASLAKLATEELPWELASENPFKLGREMLTYSAPSYTCFALFQLASVSARLCRDHLSPGFILSHTSGSIDTPCDQQVAGAIFNLPAVA